ncbi:hypothetical protein FALBO_4799 [Fusarium albosuccineum]|uniref:Uncharacterized protein n=1 Tax=Fusarium albosuccineum TaxID=1237068 RepID=A0A8H4PG14_9HYPO|nr:hypothetical protein FALBO_4799 [Fusarium albosuccineum]
MPPVPIYTASPITAAKPSGITPQTARPEDPEASAGAPQSADSITSAYPAAQPGARPSMPAPTGAPQPSANIQPTPTRTAVDVSPPAPQPGAVPTPPSGGHLPPPPKAGETQHNAQTQATEVPMPPQMSYAPPGGSEFAARRSSTTTAPGPSPMAALGSTPVQAGRSGDNFSHPPGYHQDVHASEFTSAQRAAHEASVEQEGRRPSLLGDEDGEGVWQAAKKWASAAGESLAAAENEVWKRINKE